MVGCEIRFDLRLSERDLALEYIRFEMNRQLLKKSATIVLREKIKV